MKTIPLTQCKTALVDDEDYQELSKYKWHAHRGHRGWYAQRGSQYDANGKRHTIIMSRVILSAPRGMFVDHINGDGLDNRRQNLRLATLTENGGNRQHKKVGGTSQWLGVSFARRDRKWAAQICDGVMLPSGHYHNRWIGYFDTEVEAAVAYDEVARELRGKFAAPNLIKVVTSLGP